MIHAGQTIENPATGELLTFHTTARETGGEYTLFEARILPDGTLPAAHFHPRQTERFEILSGTLTMKVGREKFEARPGDVVVIEPGVPHHFRNNTAEDVRFRVEVRPALEIEELLETMYGLAADGKTNRFGMPNPFRLAVIAKEHFDIVRVPIVPVALQRLGLALAAPIGRLLGYSHAYQRTSGTPALKPALAAA
jgi:quercetin dioxygenase-like cupin family protein